jgi:hypothetical protein
MPSGFDFRTEEEKGWDEPLPVKLAASRGFSQQYSQHLIAEPIGLAAVLIVDFLFDKTVRDQIRTIPGGCLGRSRNIHYRSAAKGS